jgi:hypothetical protein
MDFKSLYLYCIIYPNFLQNGIINWNISRFYLSILSEHYLVILLLSLCYWEINKSSANTNPLSVICFFPSYTTKKKRKCK